MSGNSTRSCCNNNDGRGSQDIAIQVKAETGTDTPIPQLKEDIDKMMQAWKEQTYPKAWEYMMRCAKCVTDPCYIKNPWGRYRNFPNPPTEDKRLLGAMGREAQNFPY